MAISLSREETSVKIDNIVSQLVTCAQYVIRVCALAPASSCTPLVLGQREE